MNKTAGDEAVARPLDPSGNRVAMDPFDLCLALGPLAAFCLLLGLLNLRRHPLVITGTRELAALAVALSGLVLVGPMQLFMPEAAATQFGAMVWLLLVAFYILGVTLGILLARPRLVVLNVSHPQLRAVLADVAQDLDSEARWAGDSLAMPRLGVQLHLEEFTPMRNVTLVASGELQSLEGWRRLELALRGALRELEVRPNPRGLGLIALGLLMLGAMLLKSVEDPQAVAQGLVDWLRLR